MKKKETKMRQYFKTESGKSQESHCRQIDEFDDKGNVVKSTIWEDDCDPVEETSKYDEEGRLVEFESGVDEESLHRYSYHKDEDANTVVVETVGAPDGSMTENVSVISPDNRVIYESTKIFSFDEEGKEEDNLLVFRETEYEYDGEGRVALKKWKSSGLMENVPGYEEKYSYHNENQAEVTDAVCEHEDGRITKSVITVIKDDKGRIVEQREEVDGKVVSKKTRTYLSDDEWTEHFEDFNEFSVEGEGRFFGQVIESHTRVDDK